jgi:pimeloyl-ACP methyl ester carboxylesterase
MSVELERYAFVANVPDEEISDLRSRLARTRFAEDVGNADWNYGVEGSYLRELVDYWLNKHDWRTLEAEINAVPQYRVTVNDMPVHFQYIRGKGPNPIPLVLTHGWPWTFWDFRKVIGPLSDPAAHGLDPANSFDVVVPSLPGFGFSCPLRRTGVTPPVIAATWVSLMQHVLGYQTFGIHGGDWGAVTSSWLAHAHADSVIAAHFSLPYFVGLRPGDFATQDFPDDNNWVAHNQSKRHLIDSHSLVHTRDPQTLGWALNDSPAGLMAWLLERRRAWSDCGGDVETRFSKEDLIAATEIYWFTQTITSSMRLYADSLREPLPLAHDRTPELEAPTGIAIFPEEIFRVPKQLAQQRSNLVQWTEMPSGGHFAAFEEPGLIVEDITKLFAQFRS